MYNVLIVDDEYYICEGLKSQLLAQKHPQIGKIRTCLSGEEALALCESFKPQIVFTDIKMEGMDGISLIHALSRRLHPVTFVVLSGYDDFHYVKGAFQNGAADYLLKPILSEDLARILSSVIDNLSGHDQNAEPARKTLFQLSTGIFQELSYLRTEDPPSPFLLSGLESSGIGESCAAALVVSPSPWPREAQIRFINQLYDSFDRMLGCPLAAGKIAVLCDARDQKALGRTLSSFVLSQKDSYAASLTACASAVRSAQLLRRAQELLCLRLFHGYGRLYTEADVCGREEFSPKLKHLMAEFLKTPALISNQMQRAAFFREIERLSLPALLRFYSYFNELLSVSFSDRGTLSPAYEASSLFDLSCLEELKEHLSRVLEQYAKSTASSQRCPGSMDMVKEYVDAHYMEDLTLASLADRFFLSYSYLSKSFHKTFHMPFQQYLLMLRMEHALELLKDPSLTIQQIAAKVGYENAFNFSRSFKARYGVSPSHFRSEPWT